MDGESVQKSLSIFHVRFLQEKMKVMKADTDYQDFQKQVISTWGRRWEEENFTQIKCQLISNTNGLIVINLEE